MFKYETAKKFLMVAATALVCSYMNISNIVSAQEIDTQGAEKLLQDIIKTPSVDSHLRIAQLASTLDGNISLAKRCETLKELIYLSIDNGNVTNLEKYGKLGRAIASQADDQELKIYSDLAFATIAQTQGQFTDAKNQIDAAMAYARLVEDEKGLFFTETSEAILNVSMGDYLSGVEQLTNSDNTLPNTLRGNWMRVTAYLTLAFIFMDVGDLEKVVNYYTKALDLARKEGISFDRETVLHNMIVVLLDLKKLELAERYTNGLQEVIEQIDNPNGRYYVYYNLAIMRYDQERFADVLKYVKLALTYQAEPYFDAELYDLAAISEAQLGNPDQAQEYLDKSQALFATMDLGEDTTSYADLTKAHILSARGKYEEAFEALNLVRRKQLKQQFNEFSSSVSDFQSSLDSILRRQQAELELATAQETNVRLIVIFALIFIATLSGVLVMQYRHNKQLDRSRIDAERANQAKSEFLANMSHELRTPLNAIIGFSEMMTHKVFGNLGAKQYDDYAEHIHQSGGLLLDIINDILDLSKVESGQVKLSEEVLDIELLFEDARMMLQKRAQSKEIDIVIKLHKNTPSLLADMRLMKQILLNLLSNAVKFTPNGGEIALEARHTKNGKIAISVKDNGQGMTPEELALALVPFGQAGTTLTRSHEGTGLGLPLTITLVELHGGQLNVQTEKDKGTTVTIMFPQNRSVNMPPNLEI